MSGSKLFQCSVCDEWSELSSGTIVHVYIPDCRVFFCRKCSEDEKYVDFPTYDWSLLPETFCTFRAVDISKDELVVQDKSFMGFYRKCIRYKKSKPESEMRYTAELPGEEKSPISEAENWSYNDDELLTILSEFADTYEYYFRTGKISPLNPEPVKNLFPSDTWTREQISKLEARNRENDRLINLYKYMLSDPKEEGEEDQRQTKKRRVSN